MNLDNWYRQILVELDSGIFTKEEEKYIKDYYSEAGLFNVWKRDFFKRHFQESFKDVVSYFSKINNPKILDLGCGVGTQSLYFAIFLGAKVYSVDLDEIALNILKKRKAYYEELFNKSIDIVTINENTLELEWSKLGEFNAVYSMFAFNMMQPSKVLLDNLFKSSNELKVAIIDGNRNHFLPKLFGVRRRNVMSPNEIRNFFRDNGLSVDNIYGGICIPPFLWKLFPYEPLRSLDIFLSKNWLMPISYQVLAQKK